MRSLGWVLTPQDWGPDKKRRSGHRHTQGRSCEDMGRRRPSTRQEQKRSCPANTMISDSILQGWEKLHSCRVSLPDRGVCSSSWRRLTQRWLERGPGRGQLDPRASCPNPRGDGDTPQSTGTWLASCSSCIMRVSALRPLIQREPPETGPGLTKVTGVCPEAAATLLGPGGM